MSKRLKTNLLIIITTYIFSIVFSELLVHYQMIKFWENENHEMGYWLGFWTPLFDALIVTVAIVLFKIYSEKELEKEAKKLEDFVQVSADYAWEINENNIFTFVSNGITTVLGYEVNEVIGKTINEFISNTTLERTSISFKSLIKKKEQIKDFQEWITHKDGTQVLLLINAMPIFKDDKFLGV